jgi:hypothetical protein
MRHDLEAMPTQEAMRPKRNRRIEVREDRRVTRTVRAGFDRKVN